MSLVNAANDFRTAIHRVRSGVRDAVTDARVRWSATNEAIDEAIDGIDEAIELYRAVGDNAINAIATLQIARRELLETRAPVRMDETP